MNLCEKLSLGFVGVTKQCPQVKCTQQMLSVEKRKICSLGEVETLLFFLKFPPLPHSCPLLSP